MITSKLPSNVQLRVAKFRMKDKVWIIDDLLKVIKGEVEAREACEGTKLKPYVKLHTSSNTSPPTTSTFVTQGVSMQCVYCKGQHYSASCDKVQNVKAWKDILLKTG